MTIIERILLQVRENVDGYYSRLPVEVARLHPKLGFGPLISRVHLSEFVIAKIMGRIPDFLGHDDWKDVDFVAVPHLLKNPAIVLRDSRSNSKYLHIDASESRRLIVVEVERRPSGHTSINTMYRIDPAEYKRLCKRHKIMLPVE